MKPENCAAQATCPVGPDFVSCCECNMFDSIPAEEIPSMMGNDRVPCGSTIPAPDAIAPRWADAVSVRTASLPLGSRPLLFCVALGRLSPRTYPSGCTRSIRKDVCWSAVCSSLPAVSLSFWFCGKSQWMPEARSVINRRRVLACGGLRQSLLPGKNFDVLRELNLEQTVPFSSRLIQNTKESCLSSQYLLLCNLARGQAGFSVHIGGLKPSPHLNNEDAEKPGRVDPCCDSYVATVTFLLLNAIVFTEDAWAAQGYVAKTESGSSRTDTCSCKSLLNAGGGGNLTSNFTPVQQKALHYAVIYRKTVPPMIEQDNGPVLLNARDPIASLGFQYKDVFKSRKAIRKTETYNAKHVHKSIKQRVVPLKFSKMNGLTAYIATTRYCIELKMLS
ncbi:hypothetical protein E5288_WYG021687 [Bos mutus]|uniref:Uncharacterized protein n=1 Tax=Bos mutus TaxID=72004 RepID=A0A6B0S477_9CETA|nr:hypothetical protein [Bos mutus]